MEFEKKQPGESERSKSAAARMEEEKQWRNLVKSIQNGKCTPFIGSGLLPRGSLTRREIAIEWADKYDYPLDDEPTLPQVAQYLAVIEEPQFPKQLIHERFEAAELPEFKGEDPYEFLANLPIRCYIDCYYDNFLVEALHRHPFRSAGVKRDYARWDPRLQNDASGFGENFEPGDATPAVFHMYGYAEKPESLIVTQHDYLTFLENVSRDNDSLVIPNIIDVALTQSYLLFLGFNFFELDFLVLLQALDQRIKKNFNCGGRPHISVQFVDLKTADDQQRAETYLRKYFGMLDISVCWASCDSFIKKVKGMLKGG